MERVPHSGGLGHPIGWSAQRWSGRRDSNPRPPPWQLEPGSAGCYRIYYASSDSASCYELGGHGGSQLGGQGKARARSWFSAASSVSILAEQSAFVISQ
jgi:hypothetical protein